MAQTTAWIRKYFLVIFKDSRYATRLPIGDINIVKNCPHDTLSNFYNDWYRPNLQAIAIVGDIDVKEMEALVKTTFRTIRIRLTSVTYSL